MKTKILSIIVLTVVVGLNLGLAKAVPDINPNASGDKPDTILLPGANIPNDEGQGFQKALLPNITKAVIGLTGGLSLLFVIIGSVQILTAYGNDERLVAAKKTLTWAIAGLVIALLSYAVVQIITSIKFK